MSARRSTRERSTRPTCAGCSRVPTAPAGRAWRASFAPPGRSCSCSASALLFGVGFDGYPYVVQAGRAVRVPGGWRWRRRSGFTGAGAPQWEVELAGMVGYIALGLAYLAAGQAADAGTGYALVASAAAVAIVVAMHAAVRVVRLTSWGLSASLVAFTAFASDAAGFLDGGTAPWLLAAQFAVALAVGLVLARPKPRGRRERASFGRPSRTPRLHLRHRRRGRRLVRALARRPHDRRRRHARRRRRA